MSGLPSYLSALAPTFQPGQAAAGFSGSGGGGDDPRKPIKPGGHHGQVAGDLPLPAWKKRNAVILPAADGKPEVDRDCNQPLTDTMISRLLPTAIGHEKYIHSMPLTRRADARDPRRLAGIRGSMVVEAILGHVRGHDSPSGPCETCRRGNGRFRSCVQLNDWSGVPFWRGACTNCVIPGHGKQCSLRDARAPAPRRRANGPAGSNPDEPIFIDSESSEGTDSPRDRPSPPHPLTTVDIAGGTEGLLAGNVCLIPRDYRQRRNVLTALDELLDAYGRLRELPGGEAAPDLSGFRRGGSASASPRASPAAASPPSGTSPRGTASPILGSPSPMQMTSPEVSPPHSSYGSPTLGPQGSRNRASSLIYRAASGAHQRNISQGSGMDIDIESLADSVHSSMSLSSGSGSDRDPPQSGSRTRPPSQVLGMPRSTSNPSVASPLARTQNLASLSPGASSRRGSVATVMAPSPTRTGHNAPSPSHNAPSPSGSDVSSIGFPGGVVPGSDIPFSSFDSPEGSQSPSPGPGSGSAGSGAPSGSTPSRAPRDRGGPSGGGGSSRGSGSGSGHGSSRGGGGKGKGREAR